jgi:site-specific recombinase XerC
VGSPREDLRRCREGPRLTVDEATWLGYRAWCLSTDHALSTAEKSVRYLKFLESHHGLALGESELDRSSVIDLLARGREAGVKPRTLNSWIREINLWLRFLELGWKQPYFRGRGQPVVRVPDRAVVRKLLALCWRNPSVNARNRAILAVLCDVGPRRNELIQMDLRDRTVSEAQEPILVVRSGKGDKYRVLWIDASTDAALASYVDVHRYPSDPKALFTTPTGRLSYGYLARIIAEAGRRVGAPWLSAHKLRHYVCDSLLDAGVTVPSVAELFGHTRLETTALYRSKRLARVRAEQEVRAASKARFGGRA